MSKEKICAKSFKQKYARAINKILTREVVAEVEQEIKETEEEELQELYDSYDEGEHDPYWWPEEVIAVWGKKDGRRIEI